MDFTQLFLEGIKAISWFDEALDIVKRNSSGRIYLIGGGVYRSIANKLYRTPVSEGTDLDFIVEHAAEELELPSGWESKKTRFGSRRLVSGKRQIDFIRMKEVYFIVSRRQEPVIENYLAGTSLSVQSIAYDFQGREVLGSNGIDSIRRRIVAVNDPEVAEYTAGLIGITVAEMIQKKADSLGFTAVYPALYTY